MDSSRSSWIGYWWHFHGKFFFPRKKHRPPKEMGESSAPPTDSLNSPAREKVKFINSTNLEPRNGRVVGRCHGSWWVAVVFCSPKKRILEDPKKEFATLGSLDSEDFFLGENYRCFVLIWPKVKGCCVFFRKGSHKVLRCHPPKKNTRWAKVESFQPILDRKRVGWIWIIWLDKNMIFLPSASRWLNRIVSSLSKITPGGNLEDHVTCVIYCRRLEVSQIFMKSSVAG